MTQYPNHNPEPARSHQTKWLIFGAILACICVFGVAFGVIAIATGIFVVASNEPSDNFEAFPTEVPEEFPTPAIDFDDPTPTPRPANDESALPDLSTVIIPPRDRYILARRFKGIDPDTIEMPTPKTYRVGDIEAFWVSNNNDETYQVDAELVHIGEHVYMWVDEGYPYDHNALVAAADRFDNRIYPDTRSFFGSEPNPGIDGDERLHILHSEALGFGIAGYFYSPSEYPSSIVPFSNEKEMFFINIANTPPNSANYDSVIAHEFQHMIHWNVDSNETSWLNEGLSELSAFLNVSDVSDFTFPFASQPDLQLNAWPEGGGGAHYGSSFLFSAYFYERFGPKATQALIANKQDGLDSVDDTLAALNLGLTADEFFAQWVVANRINNEDVFDGLYGYPIIGDIPHFLAIETYTSYPATMRDQTVTQYGADYIELFGPTEVVIEFAGVGFNRLFPVSTQNTDGDPSTTDSIVWWSNRGDDGDTTLTRTVDLTDVDSATLAYDVWFFIEDLWDYGYVEVSTDGGVTWTILETAYTTDENPNGTGFGHGYTGRSDVFRDSNSEGWLHDEIDLSDYAGQEIMIRFEMITDDAVNQPGMILDNICIDALDWCDDAERPDDGWDAQGFVRTDNILQQRYVVQLIHMDDTGPIEIIPLELDENNTGSLVVTLDGRYASVLVVSGLTRYTTEPALYRIEITERN